MMKNAFYFILKTLFAFKIFKFLSLLFGHVAKRLDKKDFEFYDVTAWLANSHKIGFIRRISNFMTSQSD